jgi:hypothetical protein
MARVLIAAQTLPGAYPTLPITPGSRVLAFQAVDTGLGNYTPLVEGKTTLFVKNTHATDAKTVTITSVADSPFGRAGDISAYSLAAGEEAPFGPFKAAGWSHGSGETGGLWINGSSSDIKVAVVTLP